MKHILHAVALAFFLFSSFNGKTQTTGDYRSFSSGNWKSATSWQRYNGTAWAAAVAAPTFNNGKIAIRTGHIILTTDSVYADQITINSGGTLHVAAGRLYLMNGAGTDLMCNGRLVVDANTVVENDSSGVLPPSSIDYKNDSLFESGGISPDITFDGTTPQVIVGSGYMNTANLNNLSGLEITGTISFNLFNFITGKISVTGSGLLVTTQYSNGFTGQNSQNFIDGKVVCIVYDSSLHTFILPIGKGKYMPAILKIRQDSLVQTSFAISISQGAPPNRNLPSTLDRVSNVRYYTLDKISSSLSHIKSGSLQLSYLADDKVSDTAKLRIAKSEGANWKNLGGIGSGLPAGIITSTVNFTTPGDFVLANSTGGGNTLPLHYISFNAFAQNNIAKITWKVGEETNTQLYQLQRKVLNSSVWQNIMSKTASGAGSYSYTDANNKMADKLLYRLIQVNKDGSVLYSKEVLLNFSNSIGGGISIAQLYPNPAGQQLHIIIQDNSTSKVNVRITNLDGRLLLSREYQTNEMVAIPVEMLKSGNYIIAVTNLQTGEMVSGKFIKK